MGYTTEWVPSPVPNTGNRVHATVMSFRICRRPLCARWKSFRVARRSQTASNPMYRMQENASRAIAIRAQ